MKIIITLVLMALTFINSNPKNEKVFYDYYDGIENAKESGKPIFLFFTGRSCDNPLQVNKLIENDREIDLRIRDSYVPVILYVDDATKLPNPKNVVRDGRTIALRTKGNEWAHIEISKYKNNVQPLMVIINSDEEMLKPPLIGKIDRADILHYLSK